MTKASGSKRKRQSNHSVYLPNHIIDRIFTFLPIKDVVSYSAVAIPFLNTWMYARNLRFDSLFKSNCVTKDISIINKILHSHLGKKIYNFHLYIPSPKDYSFFLKDWIQILASKGLEELEIDLWFTSNDKNTYYMDSDFIDHIETLRRVKLTNCELRISPNLKSLRFLKSLSLTKAPITPHFIQELFRNCVVLESLSLVFCSSTTNVIIKGSKQLRTILIRACGKICLIIIDDPNIHTFHYEGEIDKIKLIGPTKLEDVIFNFNTITWVQHISGMGNLIDILRNVQTLTINNIFLEGISPRYEDFEYKDMELYLPNLKELQIVLHGSTYVNPWDIISFVKNCPQIERLFINLGDYYAMEGGSYWNFVAKEKFENCQVGFSKLKLLKVKGYKKGELEEKLVNFIMMRAKMMESLILVSKNKHLEIRSKDIVTVSKLVTISTYYNNRDKSSVFPKHTILSMQN
uniref:At1g61320/AtMIF1 LRR domain-containing protein n=1 Tax=Solanum lycopersicum TaxID=4081 RepID=K4B9D6_SOLLC